MTSIIISFFYFKDSIAASNQWFWELSGAVLQRYPKLLQTPLLCSAGQGTPKQVSSYLTEPTLKRLHISARVQYYKRKGDTDF